MESRTADEQAIVDKLLAVSAGIKSKSRETLESLILPAGGLTRTRIASNVIQMPGSQLVDYIEAVWKAGNIEGIPDICTAIVKASNNMAYIYTRWRSYKPDALFTTFRRMYDPCN